MSKQIELSRGYYATIDDADFECVSRFNWIVLQKEAKKWDGRYALCVMRMGVLNGKPKAATMLMHRLVMRPKRYEQIDHRDGNGLNNVRENLRFCSQSQNMGNAKIRKNGTSQYKGVCWDRINEKWVASIRVNKYIWLGRHDTELCAAQAYNIAAKEHFGEFALINELSVV